MDDFNKTPNIYPNLNENISNGQKFRLNKINETKDYFLAEIRERQIISKNLSRYIAFLNYLNKSLSVLFILSGSISKMNSIRLVFSLIWLMEILKI